MDCLNHLIAYPMFHSTTVKCAVCKCTIKCFPTTGLQFHRMCGIKSVYALLNSLNNSQHSFLFCISWPVIHSIFDTTSSVYITEEKDNSLPYYYCTYQVDTARAVVNYFNFQTVYPSLLQLAKIC